MDDVITIQNNVIFMGSEVLTAVTDYDMTPYSPVEIFCFLLPG
jgi:hypothetical protein